MNSTASSVCGAAILAALIAFPAAAQTTKRYAPPPASTLSADLVSPWVNQLSRKPGAPGQRRLELAPAPSPRAKNTTVSGFTPLQANPVRSKRQSAQPARV
ncbi:MAG TPA: hypothetical protein VLQ68_11040, partial [Rhizobiaceae bacterium]|nr:hypothetical protein [Rhizobiaceae bacterium]